ncbi:MAG: ATP-binding cassette domain-containing protein [Prevotella sp.]|nr:ATP-binding cassette domain-containing protein [Prevotella sp.]
MNAIEFENVSKQYRLGLVSTGTVAHDLNRWWTMNVLRKEDPYLKIGETNDRSKKGESDYVWALKDINFSVEQGDVVGIIGKNGAGKSTLLKLLSRVTTPTTGQIRVRGRIASLLEVGTGFHPEMTGRENIFLNGAIMGMTKAEVSRKLDEIVDFSGCERYIDTPVKRYSSGMTVRLGFAIAAHLEPEILVVDEVLAVGDAEFQKKAIGKMHDVSKGEGRTVLFVSHNMSSVRLLCKNGIVLKNGKVDYVGTADDSVDYYIKNNIVTDLIGEAEINTEQHREIRYRKLHREIEYIRVKILNKIDSIATDETLHLELRMRRNDKNINDFQCGFLINDELGARVGSFTSEPISIPKDKDNFTIYLHVSNHNLAKGKYFMDFDAGYKDLTKGAKDYDVINNVISFKVKYQTEINKDEYLIWYKGWGNIRYLPNNVKVVVE